MISSFGWLGKWRISPAVTEIGPNRASMVRSEAFLLGLLACGHGFLIAPVQFLDDALFIQEAHFVFGGQALPIIAQMTVGENHETIYGERVDHAIAKIACSALQQNGHQVAFHDLYRESFDPILLGEEISQSCTP